MAINSSRTPAQVVQEYYRKIEEQLTCPISHTISSDLVIDREGHSMDRRAYESLPAYPQKICPVSNHPIEDRTIHTNLALSNLVTEFGDRRRSERDNLYENYALALVPFEVFYCKLKGRIIMKDPVVDGHICCFDRRNFEEYLDQNNNRCPIFPSAEVTHLVTNQNLKNCIDHWVELKQALLRIDDQHQTITLTARVIAGQSELSFPIKVKTLSVVSDFIDSEDPPTEEQAQIFFRFITSLSLFRRLVCWNAAFKYRNIENFFNMNDRSLHIRTVRWNLSEEANKNLYDDLFRVLFQKREGDRNQLIRDSQQTIDVLNQEIALLRNRTQNAIPRETNPIEVTIPEEHLENNIQKKPALKERIKLLKTTPNYEVFRDFYSRHQPLIKNICLGVLLLFIVGGIATGIYFKFYV